MNLTEVTAMLVILNRGNPRNTLDATKADVWHTAFAEAAPGMDGEWACRWATAQIVKTDEPTTPKQVVEAWREHETVLWNTEMARRAAIAPAPTEPAEPGSDYREARAELIRRLADRKAI